MQVLLLASRDIVGGIELGTEGEGPSEDIDKLAEKQKKQFAGCEIKGKKLGIIGLGAIGKHGGKCGSLPWHGGLWL